MDTEEPHTTLSIMDIKKQALTSASHSDFTLEALRQIAPSAFTEVRDEQGELTHKVDFDVLKELLGDKILDSDEERFGFYWVGKQDAKRAAAEPTRKTLRPVLEDSVDWDNTQNLDIEGDNLEVLKLLQRAYLGKVKMIYIDPPYNTGNDFVYEDDFAMSREDMDDAMGNLDEDGNRLRRNLDSNPRYHSDWCSMIYSRLLVARTLLSNDGVIFIDDNEVHHLRKICDEVFGASNFVAELPTIMNLKGNQDQFGFAGTHEYTLVYARNYEMLTLNGLPIDEEEAEFEWSVDEKGYYKQGAGLVSTGTNSHRGHRPKLWYPIFITEKDSLLVPPQEELDKFYDPTTKTFNDEYLYAYIEEQEKAGAGRAILPRVKGREASWRWGSERIRTSSDEVIIQRRQQNISLYKKQRPEFGDLPSKKPKTLFYKPEYSSGNGTRELEILLQAERYFSNPKPLQLLYDFLQIGTFPDSLILDFFSGSATTAHAVMQLNAEDGGKRKYICVQLPEGTPEDSEARKAGYSTICEIGKERIRRAGKKIKEESEDVGLDTICEIDKERIRRAGEDILGNLYGKQTEILSNFTRVAIGEDVDKDPKLWKYIEDEATREQAKQDLEAINERIQNLDTGFRVLRVDTSNMEEVYFEPAALRQDHLFGQVDSVKEDCSDLDLLFGCMVDWGVELSYPLRQEEVAGKHLYIVNEGALVACFEEDIDLEVIRAIAKLEPLRVLFRESCFASDAAKLNIYEQFKQLCGWSAEESYRRIHVM